MGNLPTIDSAITFLEAEIGALDVRRARLVSAVDGLRLVAEGSSSASKPAKRTAPLKGTDALVIEALTEAPLTTAGLIESCKVKSNAISKSVKRLAAAGRIRISTDTWPRRFELVKA